MDHRQQHFNCFLFSLILSLPEFLTEHIEHIEIVGQFIRRLVESDILDGRISAAESIARFGFVWQQDQGIGRGHIERMRETAGSYLLRNKCGDSILSTMNKHHNSRLEWNRNHTRVSSLRTIHRVINKNWNNKQKKTKTKSKVSMLDFHRLNWLVFFANGFHSRRHPKDYFTICWHPRNALHATKSERGKRETEREREDSFVSTYLLLSHFVIHIFEDFFVSSEFSRRFSEFTLWNCVNQHISVLILLATAIANATCHTLWPKYLLFTLYLIQFLMVNYTERKYVARTAHSRYTFTHSNYFILLRYAVVRCTSRSTVYNL